MKMVIEKKEGNVVHFSIEVPEDDFNKAINTAYLKNRGSIAIPGFRKGKVPRQIIELNFGKDVFHDEALDIVLPDIYKKFIEESGIKPIDYPEFDIDGEIEKGSPVKVVGSVEVRPEIELAKYKGIEFEKVEFPVTDELIDKEIDGLREKNARLVDSDGPVEKGHVINLDYKGFVGDEAFEGGEAQGQTLEIGSGAFIPGFEEELVGAKLGEERDVKVTFPEEYHAEHLAGKEAIFKCKVNEIKNKLLPDLDDEFAKDVSEFDTLDEYKASIRETMEAEFKEREERENEVALLEALVEANPLDVPPAMIRNQLNEEVNNFAMRIQMQGMNFDDYLKYTGSDIESLKKFLEPAALQRVKQEMILDAIATKEALEATDEDVDKEAEKLAENLNDEDKEKFKERFKTENLDIAKERIRMDKALELVKENAVEK
ncbi:MAG: trigger factor [Tissierellia bacterium]|nr:trigger factor [Tissierellia bacterium]